jgi:small GTP-binding protein
MPKNTPSLSLWSQVIKYTGLFAAFSLCAVNALLSGFNFNIVSINPTLSLPLVITFGVLAGFFAASLMFCALKDLRLYLNKKVTLNSSWSTTTNHSPMQQSNHRLSSHSNLLDQNSQDPLYKVMLVGNSGVGKSQLCLGLAENTFVDMHISTIVTSLTRKGITVDNRKTDLQLWDTPGNPRYAMSVLKFYNRAHGFLLVFDVTNRESFDHLGKWHTEITNSAPNANIILVGNKSDLEDDRQVTQEEAKHYANRLGIPYIETSAKNNTNVTECFQQLVDAITERLASVVASVQTITRDHGSSLG